MPYILKHTKWFSNRPTYTINKFGINPSSKFIYKEMEIEAYKTSPALMSQALLYVSNQVTENSAQLVAKKNSDSSYTDGKHIVVGMNPMKEHKDAYDGMDIEMGLACHEACHCAFTDFKNYDLKMVKYPIAHWLHNVYEDECIEEMLGIKKPQWMYFLNHVLSHYFSEDKFINSIKKLVLSNSKIDIVQFMILYMVRNSELSNRFPKEWIDEFGPMLDEIYEKVIVKIEDPNQFKYTPTKNTVVACLDTIEIIKKYVKLDDLNSRLSKPNLGMIGNSSTEGNPNQDKNCGQNGLFSPNTSAGRSKSNNAIKQKFDNAKNALNNNSNNESLEIKMFENSIDEIGAIKPNNSDAIAYNRIISSLKEEIRIAKRIIIPNNKKIELEDDKFHRNGQIISSHLVQAIQGVNCVYHRKVIKRSETPDPKYAFVLSLDESGSMSYQLSNEYSGRNIASKLACIFYEAMKDYDGIDLYIYGHGENIVKYVTPKDKNPYKLGNRLYQGMQNDAKSYDTILKDVRLQTNKKIFFLNITDSLYLSNKENLVQTIKQWKDRNVSFGLLCINSSENETRYNAINDEMYGDNWVSIHNSKSGMKESLIKFSNIIKKNYDKLK